MLVLSIPMGALRYPSTFGSTSAIRAYLVLDNSGRSVVSASTPSSHGSREVSIDAATPEPRVASVEERSRSVADVARYYSLKELSSPPVAKGELAVDVPDHLFRGRVTLRVWVDSEGRVQKVECLETDVPAWMTQRVIIAFGEMDFLPGELMGNPANSWFDADVDLGYIQQGPRGRP